MIPWLCDHDLFPSLIMFWISVLCFLVDGSSDICFVAIRVTKAFFTTCFMSCRKKEAQGIESKWGLVCCVVFDGDSELSFVAYPSLSQAILWHSLPLRNDKLTTSIPSVPVSGPQI